LNRTNVRFTIYTGDYMDNYGIMITRQVTDIKGKTQNEVQCFDFKRGGIWRFTLDKAF
jgi:ribosomal protein L37AE/L43A